MIIMIWPYENMVYAQPRIHLEKSDAETSLEFWDENYHLILARWPN